MTADEIPLDADHAGQVHFTDPRVRQLAEARWRLDTGRSRTEWLMLGKDNPRALIGQARDWLRAAVATRLLPLAGDDSPAQDEVNATAQQDEASCTVCGCTEDNACEGGCAWFRGSLEVDLCTACAFAIARGAVASSLYTAADLRAAIGDTLTSLHDYMIAQGQRFEGLSPRDQLELRARDAAYAAADTTGLSRSAVDPVIAPLIKHLRGYHQASEYLGDCARMHGRQTVEARKERDQLAAELAEARALVDGAATTVTTSEAAQILGVSRPTVVRLTDTGRIAHTRVSNHRRLKLADVLAFKNSAAHAAQADTINSQQPTRRAEHNPLHLDPDAIVVVDTHNGAETWTGQRWNDFVDQADRAGSEITVRLLEIRQPGAETVSAETAAAGTESRASADHDTGCDYCLCCRADRCRRGPDSGCPTNSLGESICPCTEA